MPASRPASGTNGRRQSASTPARSIAATCRRRAAANVHNNRGIAYTRIEQGDEALADFSAAITLNPRYENAHVNRGDVLHFKGEYEKAIAEYDAALEIERDDDVALFDRGNSYAALGKHQAAIADYDAAIRLNAKYQTAYFNRGNSHQALGRYAEAIADYDMAIKLKPDDVNAYAGRGYINFFLGRYAAAAGDFQHGASEDPYRAIWRYLARARSGENDTRELALNTIVKENRTLWPGPVIAFYLGQVTQAQVLAAAAYGRRKETARAGLRGVVLSRRIRAHPRGNPRGAAPLAQGAGKLPERLRRAHRRRRRS